MATPTTERRVLTSKMQLRTVGGKTFIEGYAAVFNSYSQDLGGFREAIRPGAFSRAISEKQDVRALINHDPNFVIGRTLAGTLSIYEDSTGLCFRDELPNTSVGRDLAESMSRGDIDQCSFSFSVVPPNGDEWGDDEDENGKFVSRTIKDCNLFDVSCVTYPAYLDTSCQVAERSYVEARTVAKRIGKVITPFPTNSGRYRRMTDAEIAEAVKSERYNREVSAWRKRFF